MEEKEGWGKGVAPHSSTLLIVPVAAAVQTRRGAALHSDVDTMLFPSNITRDDSPRRASPQSEADT